MGKAFSSPQYTHDPNVVGAAGGNNDLGSGYLGLEEWARNLGLGRAGESAKNVLQQMNSGNYQGLAGTLLSPIHDRFAVNLRDALRSGAMGANALFRGQQPALAAGMDATLRSQMAENEGLAYGQAIPALWGSAGGMFQNALNQLQGNQLAGLANAAKLRQGTLYTQPGYLDRAGQIAGLVGAVAAPFGGLTSLGASLGGALGGGGGGGGAGSYFSQPSSPYYVPPGQAGGGIPYNYDPGSYVPPLSGGY